MRLKWATYIKLDAFETIFDGAFNVFHRVLRSEDSTPMTNYYGAWSAFISCRETIDQVIVLLKNFKLWIGWPKQEYCKDNNHKIRKDASVGDQTFSKAIARRF